MHTAWVIVFWIALALLVYVQVGYPILLVVVSRLVRRRKPTGSADCTVTLVVPAHNEQSVLEAKLENALGLTIPRAKLEVIVASDGSTDRTAQIARSFEDRGVRLLDFAERRGKASVLNDAVAAAEGEVVCLCDANVMFRPDALELLMNRLADPSIGAVSGDVRLASRESNFGHGEGLYYRIERAIQCAESRVGSLMGVDGGMYVVRKGLFRPLPPDTILDDFVVSMNVIRQGKRVVYEPRAVAMENATPTARAEFRRRVRVSAGAMQSLKRGQWPPLGRPVACWQYLSHKLLRWTAPLLLLLLLVSSAMLWPAGGIFRIALAGQTAFYLVAGVAAVSIRFRATRLGGIPFYFAMSHAAMAVGIAKGAMNRQHVTWTRTARGAMPERLDVSAVD